MDLVPTRMLPGDRVLRVVWVPGTDRLAGLCHCGAEYVAEDPLAIWEWLLAHPNHPRGDPTDVVLDPPPDARTDRDLVSR